MLPARFIQSGELSLPLLADGNSVSHFMVGTFSNVHGLQHSVKSKVPVSKPEPNCSRLNSVSGSMLNTAVIFIPAVKFKSYCTSFFFLLKPIRVHDVSNECLHSHLLMYHILLWSCLICFSESCNYSPLDSIYVITVHLSERYQRAICVNVGFSLFHLLFLSLLFFMS